MKYSIFNSFCDNVVAFSSERNGADGGAYGNFNVCHYVGDDVDHVKRCRERLCENLNIDLDKLIIPNQSHSDSVVCIDDDFMNLSGEDKCSVLDGVDGLISNVKGICIGINTADCIPILLFDPVNRVVAAIHAGWRGVVSHIVRNAICLMSERFNCSPVDIVCAVGPHISVDAYEVGDELKQFFAVAGYDVNDVFEYSKNWGKAHLNLNKAIRFELLSCGILIENIEFSNICTFCHYDQYFSARRLGVNSGRIFSGIIIK